MNICKARSMILEKSLTKIILIMELTMETIQTMERISNKGEYEDWVSFVKENRWEDCIDRLRRDDE